MELNEAQKRAAEKLEGPVLVLAGAGSGKTKTLTQRVINLIEKGVYPAKILAITFTNKAAQEMRERILKAIETNPKINFSIYSKNDLPFISTFHSLGVKILRDQAVFFGYPKHFIIYDRDDTKKVLKEVLNQLDLDAKEWEIKKIINFISKNKANFVDLEKFLTIYDETNFYQKTMAKIWGKYEELKKNDKAFDFDDLLLETAKLLEKPEVRERYWKEWEYIHIDEYQDTNKVQDRIAELLTHPEKKNIFVVGDDDQCIYSWREADLKNILEFEKKFPEVEKIYLEQNYRSTKTIIEASNYVIEKNQERFDKKMFTENHQGSKILLYTAISERDEADFVAQRTKAFLESGTKANQIAVLYRANFQSRVLEEMFLKYGIPYQVLGTKFFDRAEIKDLVSYLRLIRNQDSMVDLRRVLNVPKRGLGKVSVLRILAGDLEALSPKAKKTYQEFLDFLEGLRVKKDELKPSQLVEFLIEKLGFEKEAREKNTEEAFERLGNMYELVEFAKKYDELDNGFELMMDEIALMGEQDSDKNEEKVKLMTIHASKGLEFEVVFIVGAEEALFSPQEVGLSKREKEKKYEEERRLFYVAMTRAKNHLIISWSANRSIYGQTSQNFLSSFVEDIPEKYLEREGSFDENNEQNWDDIWEQWDDF